MFFKQSRHIAPLQVTAVQGVTRMSSGQSVVTYPLNKLEETRTMINACTVLSLFTNSYKALLSMGP